MMMSGGTDVNVESEEQKGKEEEEEQADWAKQTECNEEARSSQHWMRSEKREEKRGGQK